MNGTESSRSTFPGIYCRGEEDIIYRRSSKQVENPEIEDNSCKELNMAQHST